MYFINPTNEQIESALESWQWLDLEDKTVVLVTAFGDLFLEHQNRIWFLDTLEGSLEEVAEDLDHLNEILETEEGKDNYLMASIVDKLQSEGHRLNSGQCYSFIINQVLGGKIEYENIEISDFIVSVDISGQIHQQVKNLPPGTKVSDVLLDGQSLEAVKSNKKWWRFWAK